jgi:LmbE family N-acetylglucosaminyl deacetylase
VVHLLREGRSKSFQVKGKKMFTAEYYDDEQMRPRVDYGKAMLTFNPYDRTKKSLLLFGLNAQGTLAAARAITRRDLSGDVVRRLVANYHLPPRLLGVVEVVVRGAVAEDGTLKKSDGLDDISVEFVAVNGLELYPQPDRDNVRGALLDLPPEEKGLVLRVRDPDQPTEDSIRIAFKWPLRAGPPEGSALAVPGEPNHRLEHRFFDHFSDRDVVVIAPHSDDCALGCGGLIYYLRHTKLWEGRRPREDGGDPRPEVHVLVMTKGLGGIDEDALAAYYVATGVAGISNAKDMARVNSEMRSEIRYNESLSEALLLDTKTVWLDLNLKTPEAHAKMRAKLWELRTKAFARRRALTVLIPGAEDEHPTHRDARELVLRVLGQAEDGYEDTRVWAYQGPWARPTRSQVTVILPLDKYAMFAKCQAIAMHQSQEARTRYSDVARTQARLFAETVPEQVFGYGATESGWDYLEVYHELHWETVFYQRRVPSA